MTPARRRRAARPRAPIAVVACACACVCVWLSGGSAAAVADAPAGVVLEVDACPSLDQAALRQLVTIEIGDLLLPPRSKARSAGAGHRMTIRCDGERIHLLVTGTAAANAAPITRTLKTSDFPGDAAPRALALAGIEMLAALSPTVRRRVDARQGIAPTATAPPTPPGAPGSAPPPAPTTPAPAPNSPSAAGADAESPLEEAAAADDNPAAGEAAATSPPSADARSSPAPATAEESPGSPPRSELLIGLAAVRRVFLVPGGVSAWGANLGLDRELGARWIYRFDLEGDVGTSAVPVGDAKAVLASLGGFFGARFGRPELSAVVAAGARLGVLRFSGDPTPGSIAAADSVWRAWGGPAVTARLVSGGARLGLSLSVEAGAALIGAEGLAGRTTVIAVRGVWVTAGAGIWF